MRRTIPLQSVSAALALAAAQRLFEVHAFGGRPSNPTPRAPRKPK